MASLIVPGDDVVGAAALEPLLAMAEDCDGSNVSTIRALVTKALSDPAIHSGFDQIKAKLEPLLTDNTDGGVLLRTLDLFSYGVYKDYAAVSADAGTYLPLTDAQVTKLRRLTVVTLVQRSCVQNENGGVVTYETLQQELGLEDAQDVVISSIYANIVFGKLCQKTKRLVVSAENGPPCRARDVPPSQAGFLLDTLKTLSQRLDNAMSQLEASKLTVQGRKEDHDQFWNQMRRPNSKVGAEGTRSTRSVKRSRGGMTPDPVGRM